MTLEQLIAYLKNQSEFMRNVTRWEVLPSRPARWSHFPQQLDPRLRSALEKRGIRQLYSHQTAAFEAIRDNKNAVIVTPTASGKTLCYNLPVLDTVLKDPDARALYLFPTKALAQDQYQELHDLIGETGADIKTYTFDGDTPGPARKAIRQAGHIVMTNPDMLHQGILPHHTVWLKLFENLRYVVIDEIHHYRGVFGSHLANVLRRLKRVAAFYGSSPQFICCSATIANPGELAEKVVGESFELIDDNGAPQGGKHFIFYNPPVVNAELNIRASVVQEVAKIARHFLETRVQSIIFARSRVRVEILTRYMREHARSLNVPADKVRGYRGGYLPLERRDIEQGLRNGDILNVVSTNALELGIDIGQLDVSIMAGYPGSIASVWQQAGRAGRRNKTSVAIIVASSSPMDQYIIERPHYFLESSPEHGIVDPDNLLILMNHMKCAAFEIPFEAQEVFSQVPSRDVLEYLADKGVLHQSGGKYHWMSDLYPAEEVSLRSSSPDNVVIVDTSKPERVIGEIDLFTAPELVHQEAIYMHQGRQFHVDQLDWDRKKAYVTPVEVDYFTDAVTKADIKVLTRDEEQEAGTLNLVFGEVNVNRVTTGYKKIKLFTHENVGSGRVYLPEIEMATAATWLEFPADFHQALEISANQLSGGLNAVATLLRNITPLFLMCDRRDIHVVPMVRSPFSARPTIYIYDSYPGGVGLSFKLFNDPFPPLAACLQLLNGCLCEGGCPSCIGPGGGEKQLAAELIQWCLEQLQP